MKKSFLLMLSGLLITSLSFAQVPAYNVEIESIKEIEVKVTNETVEAPETVEYQKTEAQEVDEEYNKLVELLKKSMQYEVQLYMIGHGLGSCTGVLIKNDSNGADILTARHCSTYDGSEVFAEGIPVTDIKVSKKDDLALFHTDEPIPDKLVAVIADSNAKIGTDLYGVGKPVIDPFPLYGKVIIRAINNDYARLLSVPGTSGAGLLNENMEIVGILWGGIESQTITVYSNVSKIKRFLREIEYIQ